MNVLDQWDEVRNAPERSLEDRQKAARVQAELLSRLDALEAQASTKTFAAALAEADRLAQAWTPPGRKATWPEYRQQYRKAFLAAVESGETTPPPGFLKPDPTARRAGQAAKKYLADLGVEKIAQLPPVTLVVETARGARVTFSLPADNPEEIARVRKAIERRGAGVFAARQPGRVEWDEPGTVAATRDVGPGARHVPVYTAERGGIAETAPTAEPIRREAIVREFAGALGIPVYERRVKSRKTLGFYRRFNDEVRLKRGATDLEVLAHEMSHYLDFRLDPSIRKKLWTPASKANEVYREELRAVSYDKGKLHEGFAEFMRLWLTQSDKAREVAPNLTAWAEDHFAGAPYGPAFRRAQEQMHAFFAQDAATRAKAKIGVQESAQPALAGPFARFRQAVTDDLQGVMTMERTLLGGIEPAGAYQTARLTRAKYSIVDGALRFGAPVAQPDGSHTFEGKGLIQILEPVSAELDNWIAYAVGRRARLLKEQGRENLFTPAEIDGMLALETPAFRKAFQDWQAFNRRVLDFAQAKGVIDPESRARWQTDVYVPFYRFGQKGPSARGRGGTPGDWHGIKALSGGTGALRDVLGNMIQNTAMLIDAGLTNESMLKIARLSQSEGSARFMAKIPKDSRKVAVTTEEARRVFLTDVLGVPPEVIRLIDQGAVPEGAEGLVPIIEAFEAQGPLMEFWQHGQKPRGDNVVVALRGGKPVYFEVADPLLLRALQALRRPAKHPLVKVLNAFRRVGQASVTFSFDFLARNVARDTLMGGIMSKSGFVPIVDSVRGMKSRIAQDANYRDFIANGGGFASYLVDEDAFKADLHRFYTRKGINPATVLDTPRKLLLAAERVADAFEMSTRLGEFRRARRQGLPPRAAAFEAREVSTDFAMRGDSQVLGFMYDSIMFLRAGVVGMDRAYRGLAMDSNRRQVAQRAALLAAVSAGLYLINRAIPDYGDLEDWDRDTYWHFFIPREYLDGGEGFVHLRYPKIWEIGAIATLAERSMEAGLNGGEAETFQAMGAAMLRMFGFDWAPQAVRPFIEQYANRIGFIDRPIETAGMEGREPFARFGPGTSRTLRALGEATREMPRELQVPPARAEALLRGYLNTWALYGLQTSDALFFDDAPDLRLDQYPVLRTFMRQDPARHSRWVTEFFDLQREFAEARQTARFFARQWRPKLADELAARREAQLAQAMGRAGQTMSGLRKILVATSEAPDAKALGEVLRAWRSTRADLYGDLRQPEPALNVPKDDLGQAKRVLLDDMLRARNAFAKNVVQTFETELERP